MAVSVHEILDYLDIHPVSACIDRVTNALSICFAQSVGQSLWQAQNIVCADMIILAKRNDLMWLHVVLAGFISGIYRLVDSKIRSNVLLRFVMVFPKLAQANLIGLHIVTPR